ncbi:unnamed protein product [Peniophora sp. CBMAI 1063]|nr:unnamed protein product [Peniophora sp. CBMAI 1063]
MTSIDGAGHLLSLKVMRVSRPALATAWEPFYSSSPSFSSHSTASVLSLQGKTPLPGHPKTLRDLTNASELLTLPAAFGAIQLGETFSGALAVNNETASAVDGVLLRVEMQTANNKVVLAEIGGKSEVLSAGDTLETVVQHEIKELGQHVLACTVTYKLPPGSRVPASGEGGDPSVQSFRKFYKFAVTNPLSVKTKVHVPRAPSATLSRAQRDKVFLEIHIQNTTPEPMSFERILLDPAPGWSLDSSPSSSFAPTQDKLFSGANALMQPQDARQYVYVLSPLEESTFFVPPEPGAVIQLGRLDISWRSAFGEPGRLLTSMLSRRIPLISPTPPAPAPQPHAPTASRPQPGSALPLHLQRSASIASAPPARPGSPGPSIPVPYTPASPRSRTMSISPRPGTPGTASSTTAVSVGGPTPVPVAPVEPLELELVSLDAPREASTDTPLNLRFALGALSPASLGRRTITLAVQHVLPTPSAPPPRPLSTTVPARSPNSSSISLAKSPRPTHGQLGSGSAGSVQLTRAMSLPVGNGAGVAEDRGPVSADFARAGFASEGGSALSLLPPPKSTSSTSTSTTTPGPGSAYAPGPSPSSAQPLGPSVQILPPLTLEEGKPGWAEFEMSWMPVRRGLVQVGGVRVLVVEDVTDGKEGREGKEGGGGPRVVREWDVVGEVWVS